MQDISLNQLKLEVHDTYEKDENISTNFEASNPKNVINTVCLEETLYNVEGLVSYIEEDYNEIKFLTSKQSIEEDFMQRAVKTTIKTVYDRGFSDSFPNADKIPRDFLFATRRRPDLKKLIDDFRRVYSKILIKK